MHLTRLKPSNVSITFFPLLVSYLAAFATAQDVYASSIAGGESKPTRTEIASTHLGLHDGIEGEHAEYQPSFFGLGRDIVGRQQPQVTPLRNNIPVNLNIIPGSTDYYSFALPTPTSTPSSTPVLGQKRAVEVKHDGEEDILDASSLSSDNFENKTLPPDLKKRQTTTTSLSNVFITVNTCIQPTFSQDLDNRFPPQLSLIVANVLQSPSSGPLLNGALVYSLSQGYASVTVQVPRGVTLGISAPDAKILNNGQWNYDIAASFDAPYHNYVNDTTPSLKWIDSDASAALLVTEHLTDWASIYKSNNQSVAQFLARGPPLSVFVSNINYTGLNGMQHSFCAQKGLSQLIANAHAPSVPKTVDMGITYSQPGALAEQQIYLPGLNKTSTYFGTLFTTNNSNVYGAPVVGGGGTIYPNMNFTTKRDANCAVLYNLTFCSDVAYSVPANPFNQKYGSVKELAQLYDSQAQQLNQNFTYSLAQVACNTTSTAQYSLAVTCDDCTAAYKTWLCAVTIPRCQDFPPYENAEADMSYLMPRNVAQAPLPNSGYPAVTNETQLNWLATNSSRNNDTIAGLIQPGPYSEVLPCEDLCYDIVRTCPAVLGFSCPAPGSLLMAASYGTRGTARGGGSTCSAPGVIYYKNTGVVMNAGSLAWVGTFGVLLWTLWTAV